MYMYTMTNVHSTMHSKYIHCTLYMCVHNTVIDNAYTLITCTHTHTYTHTVLLYQVTFVDYGNAQTVPFTYLTRLSPYECNLPAQSMECYLTCLRPSAAYAAEGTWAEEANVRLEGLVRDKRLQAKVSVRNRGQSSNMREESECVCVCRGPGYFCHPRTSLSDHCM